MSASALTPHALPRSLHARLSIGLVSLLAAVGLTCLVFTAVATRHSIDALEQRVNRDLARDLVDERGLIAHGRLDRRALEATFRDYMTINPAIEIYLLDLEGRILAFSAEPGKVMRRSVSLGPIYTFLSGERDFPLLGDDPRSHDRRKTFSVTPVPSRISPRGYLYVVLRGERFDEIDAMLAGTRLADGAPWALAATLLGAACIGVLVLRVLTVRLTRLTTVIDRYRREGDRGPSLVDGTVDARADAPAPDASGDEIERLAHVFHVMARRIETQIDDLERRDAERRELLASVSHDLRTPLAALRGYLESVKLRGASIDPDERARCLDAALRHGQRLARLVDELAELAALDAIDASIRAAPFAADELVCALVRRYESRAEAAGIRLRAETPVVGDLARGEAALVERLLACLIDNALEHTPRGGEVRVSARHVRERVELGVCDTGSGIEPGEIPRIFDRFYRADSPHRGDEHGEHAGLGLAIAQRIAELHGASIAVRSRVGVGTRFAFPLPAAPPGARAT